MFKTIYYKYIFTILAGIVITHLAFSYFMGFLTSYFYQEFMINVRNLNDDEWESASQAYLASNIKPSKKPVMLVLGSSFSYGYSLNARNAYSNLLAKQFPNYFIMNASKIGESGDGIFQKINYLKSKNITVDTLIIELSLFNFTDVPPSIPQNTLLNVTNFSFSEIDKPSNNQSKRMPGNLSNLIDSLSGSYFSFYFLHPHGFNAITNLDLNRLYTLGRISEYSYSFVPLPDTYLKTYSKFKKDLPQYDKFITALLTSSLEVSQNVYFFVAPIYGNGIKKSQFKLTDTEHQLLDLYHICQRQKKIACLNPGIQFQEQYFMNLSHYNEEGHRALSKWMTQQLLKSSQNHLASNYRADVSP
jgi:hypothetical protein